VRPPCLRLWQEQIEGLMHRHEGYRAITVDVTLATGLAKLPKQTLPSGGQPGAAAVIFGMIGEVGHIGGQRACPLAFERVHPQNPSESRLWQALLGWARRHLASDDVAVMDAVKLADVHAAGLGHYLLRWRPTSRLTVASIAAKVANPSTARRSARFRQLQESSPDRIETWVEGGVAMRAEIWEDLILPGVIPGSGAKTFRVYAIYHPAYTTPWLLATPLRLKAASVKAMYQDRWPVEQIPLAAKQMVGAHRQFVHADESIQRLPELALLAGSILSYLAATLPAAPTGFWDRQPKPTPGRFRRMLMGKPFPQSYPVPGQIRKKASVTGHLPKGTLAPRRKSIASAPVSPL
jgi:hypothetical protein